MSASPDWLPAWFRIGRLEEIPRRGARRVLVGRASLLENRIAAYAGWADGFTETVLGLE
jgi:hypothetical protein